MCLTMSRWIWISQSKRNIPHDELFQQPKGSVYSWLCWRRAEEVKVLCCHIGEVTVRDLALHAAHWQFLEVLTNSSRLRNLDVFLLL